MSCLEFYPMREFRPWLVDQPHLFPPSPSDWLDPNHMAVFVRDFVGTLDLSCITSTYGLRGAPAYDPRLLVALLLYAYMNGMPSSRGIERALRDQVDFRYIGAGNFPDHDSIANFRKVHLKALASLFVQVLGACQKAGLVKSGTVKTLDGTKVLANASRRKTHSLKSLEKMEIRLAEEINADQLRGDVKKYFTDAERIDAQEDALYGDGPLPGRIDPKYGDPVKRHQLIQDLIADIKNNVSEQVDREAAAAQAKIAARENEEKNGAKKQGRKPKPVDREQREMELMNADGLCGNTTDPDSRLMKDGATKAIVQAYNAQAVVDPAHQIIVAACITQDANDKKQLVPMILETERILGEKPQ